MDITAAQWLDAGSKVLGSAMSRPPASSRAESGVYSPFEGGDFQVNTGGAQLPIAGDLGASLLTLLVVGVVGVILWKRLKA